MGRIHTGVGNYYGSQTMAENLFPASSGTLVSCLFSSTPNIIVSAAEITWNNVNTGPEAILDISGTKGREMLTQLKQPPEWFMRPEISAMILDELRTGKDVFL